MERTLVTVSRKWHEPFIRIDVTTQGIGITMTMEDFIEAIRQETGHDVRAGAERIIDWIKKESTKAL